MAHLNRSRRKANDSHRKEVEAKSVQPKDHTLPWGKPWREASLQARYPVPPNYRPAHNAPQPDQPRCYLRSV